MAKEGIVESVVGFLHDEVEWPVAGEVGHRIHTDNWVYQSNNYLSGSQGIKALHYAQTTYK